MVINLNAIEEDGGERFAGLLAGWRKARGAKLDIQRLPFQGGATGENLRLHLSAIIQSAIRRRIHATKGFVDIHLVAILKEDAAVAGSTEIAEFNVHLAVAEFF